MYYCDKCDKRFEKRKAYIGHCSSHNRGESYKNGRKKKEDKKQASECKYCGTHFDDRKKLGGHTATCKLNPNNEDRKRKLSIAAKNRVLTKETRDKISVSRKRYLDKNPGKIPYLLNHSSSESYPEMLIRQKLERESITGWIQEYPVKRYSLDFAFVDILLDVEIDGGTHQLEEVKRKDDERDYILKSLGWRVLRLSAKDIKEDLDREFEKIKKSLVEQQE